MAFNANKYVRTISFLLLPLPCLYLLPTNVQCLGYEIKIICTTRQRSSGRCLDTRRRAFSSSDFISSRSSITSIGGSLPVWTNCLCWREFYCVIVGWLLLSYQRASRWRNEQMRGASCPLNPKYISWIRRHVAAIFASRSPYLNVYLMSSPRLRLLYGLVWKLFVFCSRVPVLLFISGYWPVSMGLLA